MTVLKPKWWQIFKVLCVFIITGWSIYKMKIKREKKTFAENELVWARMRFCPYWPARIVVAPPSLGKIPANKICILFFGTKQFGFVQPDKIETYIENRSKYIAKGRGAMFSDAVKQIEEYISDPLKNKRNAHVKPSCIVVKTERTVEQILGIKCEPSTPNDSVLDTSNTASSPDTNSWVEEKKALIDDIVRLKSENQKMALDLKKSEEKLESLNITNRELAIDVSRCRETHLKEMDGLRSDVAKLNAMVGEMKVDRNKRISELTREKDLSQAKLKQLQNTITQQTQESEDGSDEDGFHEVECLLRDKLVPKRVYLVRWKGCNSSQDSWILESDLSCPEILQKYKQLKRKK